MVAAQLAAPGGTEREEGCSLLRTREAVAAGPAGNSGRFAEEAHRLAEIRDPVRGTRS